MFKKPFSFDGRIRRTEFGISFIICYIAHICLVGLMDLNGYIFCIPFFFFFFSQAAKRSHDMDKSGWFTLIPLYNPFFLLFREGTIGANKYGKDPKYRITDILFRNSSDLLTTITVSLKQKNPIIRTENIDKKYLLSEDGKILLKWLDTQVTAIDMQADPDLRNVTTIGRDAFYNCNKLSNIIFTGQLTTIQKAAFEDCEKLQHLSFPSQVNFIGEFLFGRNCIETINIESEIPPRLEGNFSYNDEKLQAIYVTTSDISLYRNNESWKKYAHIIRIKKH